MKTIEILPKAIDLKKYRKQYAKESDASTVIDEDVLITQNGVPAIMYMKLDPELTKHIRWAVRTIKYAHSNRTSYLKGMGGKNTSRIFGFMPRRSLRNNFCSVTAMAKQEPKQHYVFTEFSKFLSEIYKEHFPDKFEEHMSITHRKIKDMWQIKGSPFTSGIVNKDNALAYHHDSGNIKGMLSNMVGFKRNIEGGRLCCPEYDVKFEISDSSLVIFNGQEILHGVTPIKKLSGNSYRHTVVYYTLQQMWNCGDVNLELDRVRKIKRDREHKRLNNGEQKETKENNS